MYERLTKRVQGRRDEGFTLIELLIVIVILGILAAIVVFAIGQTRGDSVASSCKTNFKSVELSAEAVKTKTGSYPATSTGLVATSSSTNGALLKEYPTSADYNLSYASGVITVQKPGATAGSWTNVTTNATSVAGCDELD